MKKVWNSIVRPAKNAGFQNKAIRQAEKISAGEVTVAAPKHKTEKAYFERAQKDEKIRKDLEAKDEGFISKINQLEVKASEIKESYPTQRELPSWESERLHKNDHPWEYGFYEPPAEKISKGKLMFREALEILHARLELFGSPEIPRPNIATAEKTLKEHPAIQRIGEEGVEKMWKYFRPFERHDTQNVVRISELARLQAALENGPEDEESFLEVFEGGFRKLLDWNPTEKEAYEKLDEVERKNFMKGVMHQRATEQKRLNDRLAEIESDEAAMRKESEEKLEAASRLDSSTTTEDEKAKEVGKVGKH